MENRKILLGLTTNSGTENWKNKIKEIDKLGITEISLFPTPLEKEERYKLYALLEKTKLKSIPHVHLREEDSSREELEYFIKRWGTKVFNLHATKKALEFIERNCDFKEMIFLENLDALPVNFEKMLEKAGGLCLDLSHYQDFGLLQNEKTYIDFEKFLNKYNIGCNHISAVKKTIQFFEDKQNDKMTSGHTDHFLSNLKDVDYVKGMPKKYFANYVSIELENPFTKQLKVKEHLEKIINQ